MSQYLVNSTSRSVNVNLNNAYVPAQAAILGPNTARPLNGAWTIDSGVSPPDWTSDEVFFLDHEPSITELGILARITALESA